MYRSQNLDTHSCCGDCWKGSSAQPCHSFNCHDAAIAGPQPGPAPHPPQQIHPVPDSLHSPSDQGPHTPCAFCLASNASSLCLMNDCFGAACRSPRLPGAGPASGVIAAHFRLLVACYSENLPGGPAPHCTALLRLHRLRWHFYGTTCFAYHQLDLLLALRVHLVHPPCPFISTLRAFSQQT